MRCIVDTCRTVYKRKTRGVSLFQFPKDHIMKDKWLKVIGISKEMVKENSRICALHFPAGDILKLGKRRELVSTAVPKFEIPDPMNPENATSQEESPVHVVNVTSQQEIPVHVISDDSTLDAPTNKQESSVHVCDDSSSDGTSENDQRELFEYLEMTADAGPGEFLVSGIMYLQKKEVNTKIYIGRRKIDDTHKTPYVSPLKKSASGKEFPIATTETDQPLQLKNQPYARLCQANNRTDLVKSNVKEVRELGLNTENAIENLRFRVRTLEARIFKKNQLIKLLQQSDRRWGKKVKLEKELALFRD